MPVTAKCDGHSACLRPLACGRAALYRPLQGRPSRKPRARARARATTSRAIGTQDGESSKIWCQRWTTRGGEARETDRARANAMFAYADSCKCTMPHAMLAWPVTSSALPMTFTATTPCSCSSGVHPRQASTSLITKDSTNDPIRSHLSSSWTIETKRRHCVRARLRRTLSE